MRLTFPTLAIATLIAASSAHAQAGARRAAPSTRAIAEVSLTLTDTAAQRAAGAPAVIRVDYGQPHLRGRRINTDSLVPMGTVWRLGANAATLLTTDVDLSINETVVPKGRYIMQALPAASGWTLILQSETTGAAQVMLSAYSAAKDFARIPLRHTTLASPVESFSVWLIPSTAPGAQRGELRMAWDTTQLSVDWIVK